MAPAAHRTGFRDLGVAAGVSASTFWSTLTPCGRRGGGARLRRRPRRQARDRPQPSPCRSAGRRSGPATRWTRRRRASRRTNRDGPTGWREKERRARCRRRGKARVIDMPGLRTAASLASDASTRMVRAAGSMRLSMAVISPLTEVPASAADEAVTAWPSAIGSDDPLGHVEGDGRPRTCRRAWRWRCGVTRSPTETSVRPTTPAKGALIERFARSSSAVLRSISASRAAWRASRQDRGRDVAGLLEPLRPVQFLASAIEREPCPFLRDKLIGRIKLDQNLSLRHLRTGGKVDCLDDTGHLWVERDGFRAAAAVPIARISVPKSSVPTEAVTTSGWPRPPGRGPPGGPPAADPAGRLASPNSSVAPKTRSGL